MSIDGSLQGGQVSRDIYDTLRFDQRLTYGLSALAVWLGARQGVPVDGVQTTIENVAANSAGGTIVLGFAYLVRRLNRVYVDNKVMEYATASSQTGELAGGVNWPSLKIGALAAGVEVGLGASLVAGNVGNHDSLVGAALGTILTAVGVINYRRLQNGFAADADAAAARIEGIEECARTIP